MSRGIEELLAAAVDERARSLDGLRPAAGALARTRSRVRRRRAVRHSVETGVGVAAVGVVGVALWWGGARPDAPLPPSGSTAPAPATPTPAPSPAPSSATRAPTPAAAPGLPPALPAPDDLLARVGPGWTLTVYRSVPAGADPLAAPTAHAVLAVAPDGTRYRLADLPAELGVRVLHWRAGDESARVSWGPFATDDMTTGWLDLRTGDLVTDAPDLPRAPDLPGASYLADVGDSGELWLAGVDGDAWSLYVVPASGEPRALGEVDGAVSVASVSPDDSRVAWATAAAPGQALVVVDVATGDRTQVPLDAPDGECSVLGWLDDASVLASCFDYTGDGPVVDWDPRLERIGVDDGSVARVQDIGVGDPFVPSFSHGAHTADGTVAFPAFTLTADLGMASVCANSVWSWGPDGLQEVRPTGDDVLGVGAAGDDVLVESTTGCMQGAAPSTLTAHAPGASGTATILAPVPDDGAWSTALVSWTPAD
ncbi:hypothetical protein [Cellulomonas composti]|uniref:Uncharacterized protein n=1 Tax=Cellulomonas composti TaxID=266130 RepID=A0A511JF21_9CELL|nr:hypothetical protein [Cellulomonas composti]GEL96389.1 hypothetical protein CCO02nite_30470 [Cellulomonas composti]